MSQKLPHIGSLWVEGSLSYLEQMCLLSFVANGHEVTLFNYGNIDNVPEGINLLDAREVHDPQKIIFNKQFGTPVPQSDIFRLHMIKNTGMIWADVDMFCVKPINYDSKHIFGFQDKSNVCNALLGLPHDSPALKNYLKYVSDEYPIPPWWEKELRSDAEIKKTAGKWKHASQQPHGIYGPAALTWFLKESGEIEHAQNIKAFYPVPFRKAGELSEPVNIHDRYFTDETKAAHMWGRRNRWWIAGRGVRRYSFIDRRTRSLKIDRKAAPIVDARGERDVKRIYEPLTGIHYIDFLAAMHDHIKPNWYFEIGTQTGKSLAVSKCNSIAVDPYFRIKTDIISKREQCHLFQMESDNFFERGILEKLVDKVDFAFLDGMHLFEFLLRDFINTEKCCIQDSVITMHDCIPINDISSARKWDRKATKTWTGDVWKLIPILRKYRPDLDISVFDCPPSGLTVVTNLDPNNMVLQENYETILEEFLTVSIAEYGQDQLFKDLCISNSRSTQVRKLTGNSCYSEPNQSIHKKKLKIKIQLPSPPPRRDRAWGDHYFGTSLAKELHSLGHDVELVFSDQKSKASKLSFDAEVVIRGPKKFIRTEECVSILWIISHSDNVGVAEVQSFDHTFVASTKFTKLLEKQIKKSSVSTLLQCSDTNIFYEDTSKEISRELLFVGNRRKFVRNSVTFAVKHEFDLSIWGLGWKGSVPDNCFHGAHIRNNKLGDVYRSSNVVLNDHRPEMVRDGFNSNRIFDVLACGRPIVSDSAVDLPRQLKDLVYTYTDEVSFKKAVKSASDETDKMKKMRTVGSAFVKKNHSFRNRAIDIEAKIFEIMRSAKSC